MCRVVPHCICLIRLIAEQLPSQQPREAAGPQVHGGPSHQYHLLQNEGAVPSFVFVCLSIHPKMSEL